MNNCGPICLIHFSVWFATWRQQLEGSMEEADSKAAAVWKYFRLATQTAFFVVFAKLFT